MRNTCHLEILILEHESVEDPVIQGDSIFLATLLLIRNIQVYLEMLFWFSICPELLMQYEKKLHELITSPALMNSAGKTASIQASFERKASQNVLGWARFNFIILSLTEVLVNMLIFDKSKQPDCLTYR